MRAVNIKTEPFEFITILDMTCIKEFNRHGYLTITGIAAQDKIKEYFAMTMKEKWVSIKLIDEHGAEKDFFTGLLTRMKSKKEKQFDVLTIEVSTGTYQLDIDKHLRSFQNKESTYEKVLEDCVRHDGGKFIMLMKNPQITNRFIMQYRETDWEFIHRLASYAETVFYPEFLVPGCKFYFGFPKGSKIPLSIIEDDNYSIERNYEEYEAGRGNKNSTYASSEITEYIIHSREVYGLGDTADISGKSYVIRKINSRMEDSEVCHDYYLAAQNKCRAVFHNNTQLRGLSVQADVSAVKRDQVQVAIAGDENKTDSGNKWFPYATVYSTPDGTGWYCMPETGDRARLTFPSDCEEEAYVSSSVHLEHGSRTDPSKKSWKNAQDKEILFTPDSLILRNNNGLSIELSDSQGIHILSNKNISLQTDKELNLRSSSGNISLNGNQAVSLQQGGASIQLDSEVKFSGGKIKMN